MQPIYLGKFLVTQEQYVQVMGVDERLRFRGGQLSSRFGANFPVDWTDWEYAEMFCERMSLLTRQVVRLPTEAEWEYSCRAGTRAIYGASDEASDLDRIAWFGYNSNGGIRPVGQKEPNGFGLYDMLGNTQQWCADWYGEYTKDDSVDPQGPAQGKYRVSRGCSYIHAPEGCRVALRNSTWPNDRKGFRVRVSVFRTPFPASPPLPAVRPQWPQTDPPDPASTSKSASSSSSGPGF
jgi:formylglycine-generating enzyme required for sulfatase activity